MKLNKSIKKNLNDRIYDLCNIYHSELPLTVIFDILRDKDIIPLQEDGTPWSGFVCG